MTNTNVTERTTNLNDIADGYPADDALAVIQRALAQSRADTATPEDLVAALTVLRHLREELAGWEPELITAARERKVSEERVRAQRDRRAGDRAVAAWAHDNAAVLRQLAGQVSAQRGLPAGGQHRVDLVGQALGDDDPASLVSPLADAHTHLVTTHTGLAAQIQTLTDQARQIRHTTHVTRSG